jgi:hypothetical protein
MAVYNDVQLGQLLLCSRDIHQPVALGQAAAELGLAAACACSPGPALHILLGCQEKGTATQSCTCGDISKQCAGKGAPTVATGRAGGPAAASTSESEAPATASSSSMSSASLTSSAALGSSTVDVLATVELLRLDRLCRAWRCCAGDCRARLPARRAQACRAALQHRRPYYGRLGDSVMRLLPI